MASGCRPCHLPSTCPNRPLRRLRARPRRRRLLLPLDSRPRLLVCRVSIRWLYTKSDFPSDRLPTVSASEALLSLQSRGPRSISTGLDQLNSLLGATNAGLGRGKITEIWGPCGSAKSSLA